MIGQPLSALDSPQLLLDLDILDANLERMQQGCRKHGVNLRVHFKSLKCGGLAKYLAQKGISSFLAAKLNEAEVLADAGISDILLANEIIGPIKLRRLAALAKRVPVMVCVDDLDNIAALGEAMKGAGARLDVLVEVNVGMNRCGAEPGEPVVKLARAIAGHQNLRFAGLQGYDGHLQMLPDATERQGKCLHGLASLLKTRDRLKEAGFEIRVITGGGTGTWEWVASFPGMTEVQPGSFLLMDAAYHAIRPEFACSLSILATVISHQSDRYVLDAGSKAISKDFGMPFVKDHDAEKVLKLAEEHTIVETHNPPAIGERREVLPAHCCATMNLHRTCIAVRNGVVEAVWPIEASGRYD
jgi:D-serine deaminase-like pyridoxal phosphate-dependent protein